MMLVILFVVTFRTCLSLDMIISSMPCQLINDEQVRCQQTSFNDRNLPWINNRSQIKHFQWIGSGAFILGHHQFDRFPNVRNLSLRSNAITSLSLLPFWSYLSRVHHLDLSQNRLSLIHERDFRSFSNLISLNISLNFLTTIEPIWLTIPLQILDLSRNGLNSIGYIHLQNSSSSSVNGCSLREIYLNENRGLLSLVQLQSTMMDPCTWLTHFQLINNHWHCSCPDVINGLKSYRTLNLVDDQTVSLTGHCETPLTFRHFDIQKLHEEFLCDRLLLFDSTVNDDLQMSSKTLPRHMTSFFFIGCLIGLIIGLCLHYCARRCHLLFFYIIFKCDREKATDEPANPTEIYPMAETMIHRRSNPSSYCPSTASDSLPSYAQVMNDVFYLDLTHRTTQGNTWNDLDGEC